MLTDKIVFLLDSLQRQMNCASRGLSFAYAGNNIALDCRSSCYGSCGEDCSGSCSGDCSGACADNCSGSCEYGSM